MARRSLIAGAIAVVVAIVLLGFGSGLFVDALWFRQLGVWVVFRTALVAKIACFTLAFATCYVVVAAVGLAAVRHTRTSGVVQIVSRRTGNGPATLPELLAPFADRLPWRAMVLAAAAVIAVLVAVTQTASWQTYLLWLHGGEFGVRDPYFDLDVGFFVFALPAYPKRVRTKVSRSGSLRVLPRSRAPSPESLFSRGSITTTAEPRDARTVQTPLPDARMRIVAITTAR